MTKTLKSCQITRFCKNAQAWISHCPELGLWSQGVTRERALVAIGDSAMVLALHYRDELSRVRKAYLLSRWMDNQPNERDIAQAKKQCARPEVAKIIREMDAELATANTIETPVERCSVCDFRIIYSIRGARRHEGKFVRDRLGGPKVTKHAECLKCLRLGPPPPDSLLTREEYENDLEVEGEDPSE